jgi:hypothetical protein
MDEDELLRGFKEASEAELRFYSNRGKPERERWVVKEFLNLNYIEYDENEMVSHEQCSKVDVEFRCARFQIKEIVDPSVNRSKHAKESFNGLKDAIKLEDMRLPSAVAFDVPKVENAYQMVLEETRKLSIDSRYEGVRSNIDLLFYITRTRTSLIKVEEIIAEDWISFEWRSVCCLIGNQAIVLHSTLSSPRFLVDIRLKQA